MTSAKFSDYFIPLLCHVQKSADSVAFVCFLGTPLPAPTADIIYGSPHSSHAAEVAMHKRIAENECSRNLCHDLVSDFTCQEQNTGFRTAFVEERHGKLKRDPAPTRRWLSTARVEEIEEKQILRRWVNYPITEPSQFWSLASIGAEFAKFWLECAM